MNCENLTLLKWEPKLWYKYQSWLSYTFRFELKPKNVMIRWFTLRAIRDFDSGVALHAQWNQIIAFEIWLFTDTCLRRHVGGYWSVAKVSAKILSFLPQKQIEASQIAGHYGKGKFWFTFFVSHFSFSNFFKLEFSKEKFGKLRGVLLLCFYPKKHYTWFQKLTDLQRIFRYLL